MAAGDISGDDNGGTRWHSVHLGTTITMDGDQDGRGGGPGSGEQWSPTIGGRDPSGNFGLQFMVN